MNTAPARALFREATRRMRDRWRDLISFSLLFDALAIAVFYPVGNWILGRLISTGDQRSLGNEQILAFLLSPFGGLVLLLSGSAAFAFVFLRHGGLVWIGGDDLHGRPADAGATLMRIATRSPQFLKLGAIQLGITLLLLSPILAAGGAIFLALTSNHDLYYLVSVRPPSFWIGAIAGGALAITAVILVLYLRVRWAFAVPLHLYEDAPPREAMSRSRKIVRGSVRRVGMVLVGWWLACVLAGLLGTAAIYEGGQLLVSRFSGSVAAAVVFAATLLLLETLFTVCLALVASVVDSLLVLELYRELRDGGPGVAQVRPAGRDRRSRLFLLAVAGGLVALAVVLVNTVSGLVEPARQVEVTAHRGSSLSAPENSLSALRHAIRDGADYAEIDVQELADGAIVLIHDTDLLRIAGVKKPIWEVTLEEIRTYDAGSWFSPEFAGERIATLEEAIEVCRDRLKLNIELKFNGHEKALVESTLRIIEEEDFGSQCVLTSLKYAGLEEVLRLGSTIPTGFIVFQAVGDLTTFKVDFLSVRSAVATYELVRRARRRGLDVHVWTVNSPGPMLAMVDRGVANILTDDPALLRQVLNDREQLSDAERVLLALRNWWWR